MASSKNGTGTRRVAKVVARTASKEDQLWPVALATLRVLVPFSLRATDYGDILLGQVRLCSGVRNAGGPQTLQIVLEY